MLQTDADQSNVTRRGEMISPYITKWPEGPRLITDPLFGVPPRCGIKSALIRARAKKLPATLTEEEWERVLKHFKGLCAYCGGEPWRLVEHVVSIERGGGTTFENCLPACGVASRSLSRLSIENRAPELTR